MDSSENAYCASVSQGLWPSDIWAYLPTVVTTAGSEVSDVVCDRGAGHVDGGGADLAGIGSTISAANAAAATRTTGVLAAAEDEVSAAIASLFSSHGQEFQAISAQAAAFHSQFVQALSGAGSSYAAAEAANASPLQAAVQGTQGLAVFSPCRR